MDGMEEGEGGGEGPAFKGRSSIGEFASLARSSGRTAAARVLAAKRQRPFRRL